MNKHFSMSEGSAKKPFVKPFVRVVEIDNADIICTSGEPEIYSLDDGGSLF